MLKKKCKFEIFSLFLNKKHISLIENRCNIYIKRRISVILTGVIAGPAIVQSTGILADRLIDDCETELRVASYRVVLLERVKRHWS